MLVGVLHYLNMLCLLHVSTICLCFIPCVFLCLMYKHVIYKRFFALFFLDVLLCSVALNLPTLLIKNIKNQSNNLFKQLNYKKKKMEMILFLCAYRSWMHNYGVQVLFVHTSVCPYFCPKSCVSNSPKLQDRQTFLCTCQQIKCFKSNLSLCKKEKMVLLNPVQTAE